ncbi:MAG: hypothetical protein EHM40_00940 [Chloroflexi bacterium]|nr:MAG: hypothetical protein EHM40_05655 [Chloroflexota bacterium]RPI96656.1 MAG: hypothetical protein EHM40_00940 [Chloroflexota bacterium]
MSVIILVFVMLVSGFTVGLVTGLIILCIDRHRKRSSKTLHFKDGITLEYDCSPPAIYERIRAFFDGK